MIRRGRTVNAPGRARVVGRQGDRARLVEPPPLKEGHVRCGECGASVPKRKDGSMRGHQSLKAKVSCIGATPRS